MSTTVDSRIVEMRFDNKQFESNVATSMSTLDKLKKSLNLTGAAKGLEDINSASKRFDMSGMSSAVDTVSARFSALQVMGVTALANITNSAVNAGKRMIAALTIDPIKTGFQEYETQINAVQTILANTQSKGTTLKEVNAALDELNTYADKTIYNFTEMTRNIGTFTAAGIDLDTSVSAIQGIANLAAVSGSTSQQASTAMYQLSQALASGTVKLMDWNSVVNAGMGGQVFQDALKKTSEELKTGAEAAIKAKGSFRESLSEGWLTAEVLTETLKKFTTSGANEYIAEYTGLSEDAIKSALDAAEAQYGEADAIDKAAEALAEKSGKNKEEIKQALEFAKTAEDAATKVKTFSQLWDTLKEAAQSGWTQSWEIIVGDFEEAKALLTNISDTIGGVIGESANARNALLQGWKDLGGRNDLIDGFKNIFDGIVSIVKPIREAFSEIFESIKPADLVKVTKGFKDLTAKLIISSETAEKFKRIFKGVFSIFDFAKKVITGVGKAIADLLGSKGVSSLGGLLLDAMANIGDFFTSINEGFDSGGLTGMLSKVVGGISNVLAGATNGIKGFADILGTIGDKVASVAGKIWDSIKTVFSWIADNISAGDIFAGLAGGGIFVAAKKLSGFLDKIISTIKDLFSKDKGVGGIKDSVTDILDSLHDSLTAFSAGIKVSSLVAIAVAVGILSMSLRTISQLDAEDIGKSLLTIGIMLGMLSKTLGAMTKTLQASGSKGLIKSAFSLILVAEAIKVLADAIKKLSDLSLGGLAKGLIGVGVGLGELAGGLKLIGKTKISLSTSVAMLALAESCKILAGALVKFGQMTWDEIGRGLSAMGGALGELVGTMSIMNKVGGGKSIVGSVGILIVVQSLKKMADGLKSFAEMSWAEIGRGLSAMGGALAELAGAVGGLGKLAGFSSLLGAGSIVLVVQGLGDLASAFKEFGGMSWDEIGRGVVGMGGALGELAGITGGLGALAGFSGLLGAGTILIAVQGLGDLADAFAKFGQMAWDEIGRGLVGMGGALLEVGGMSGGLGALAGFSGLFGAGTIWVAIQGLGDLADALVKFGEMTWDEIGRGLSAMGGALLEVGGISGGLGALTGIAGIFGAGAIWVAVQGLDDLANSLKKFGEMSWDEIGRGLTAMAGALSEIAVGGLLNTFSILGSISIENIAEPLGMLADSVKKWAGVTVPENLGLQLGLLADGIMKFTFGGMGASALAEAAAPLGTMADSVGKWTGVVVPENLGTQLGQLASGVKAFTFGEMGASAISEVAGPLGTMADSVGKWSGVTVPEGLGEQLSSLARGVRSFSFAFMGGWSISAISGPLGELAGSVTKWSGVSVPENVESGLEGIANGIKAFSFAFVGGWTVSEIVAPLGSLADSVKKWAGITVSESIKTGLTEIASGIKEFSLLDSAKLALVDGPLNTLGDAFKKLSGITVTGNNLVTLAKNIKTCGTELAGFDSTSISTAISSVNKLVGAVNKVNGTNVGNVGAFVSAANKLNDIKISEIKVNSGNLSSAISAIKETMTSMSKTISSSKSSLDSAMKTALSGISGAAKSKISEMTSAANALTSALAKAISSKKPSVTSACKSLASEGVKGIRANRSSFETAGEYLGAGLVIGINSKQTAAYNAGYALGQKAAQGEKDGQDSASPSKLTIQAGKWLGDGLIIGMESMYSKVYKSGYKMGDETVSSISSAISQIRDTIDSDMDVQPTIRPVLDLSDVESGAGSINRMLDFGSSVGVLSNVNAISTMMNRRNQNGGNTEIISAIDKLRKDIGNVGGTSYTINGITYDDGSNVSEAVKALVRAARVERRV